MTQRHPIAAALLESTLELRYGEGNSELDVNQVFEAAKANIAILDDADIRDLTCNLINVGAGDLATQLLIIHGNYKKRAALPEDTPTNFEGEEGRPN